MAAAKKAPKKAAKKAAKKATASSNTKRQYANNRLPLSLLLDTKTAEFLARRARTEGTSKSALVSQAIQAHYGLQPDNVARRPRSRTR